MQHETYDVITIGAGAAGLVTAIGSAALGKKSALLEARQMGGDCTNYGCIPSKALIAAAKAAHNLRTTNKYSLGEPCDLDIDFGAAMRRVRDIIERIREHESPEVLKDRGVDVFLGKAVFKNPHEIEVHASDGSVETLYGANIVIATGSYPFVPPIKGMDNVRTLTNETIFDLEERIPRLIVIGGGPIGCEIGQSMSRLGSDVTIIEGLPHLLAKEDETTSILVKNTLEAEGMRIIPGVKVVETRNENGSISVMFEDSEGKSDSVQGDAIFMAVGRRAKTDGMNLEAAGVELDRGLIKVNSHFQTAQPHVYACGDCIGGLQFTHVAEAEAKVVVRNILFPYLKGKMDYRVVPWTTFLDPEIAHVGMLKKDAEEKFGTDKIHTYRYDLTDLDRAVTESEKAGFIEIVTMKWSGKILGSTIVASRAGEMMSEVCLAMKHKIPVYKLSSLIHAYPTFTLGIRKAADLYFVETLAAGVKNLKEKLWPFKPVLETDEVVDDEG